MNRRIAGIVGLAGALGLFIGDMLLYGHLGGAGGFLESVEAVASNVSHERIFIGGILGPICSLLYIIGFWHVYQNIQKSGKIAARTVVAGCAVLIVIGGTYHALWAIRMLIFKHGIGDTQSLEAFVEAVTSYLKITFIASSIPGFVVFPMLIVMVLLGRTGYPRWTVILNPGLLISLSFLVSDLPAPYGLTFYGGYINLVFVVFFVVSVITTWRDDSGA